jgi:hypothetical protein
MNKQHLSFPDKAGMCTTMHEALSFITGHTAMWAQVNSYGLDQECWIGLLNCYRQMEANLQRLNPKIASPYWDLTMDVMRHSKSTKALLLWNESVLFDNEWFGSISKKSLAESGSKWFSKAIRPRDKTYAERNAFGFTTMVPQVGSKPSYLTSRRKFRPHV